MRHLSISLSAGSRFNTGATFSRFVSRFGESGVGMVDFRGDAKPDWFFTSSPNPSKNAFSSSTGGGGATICDCSSNPEDDVPAVSSFKVAFSKAASVKRICFERSKFFNASEKFKCSNIRRRASSENKIDMNAHVSLSSLEIDGSLLCERASHNAFNCCSSFDLIAA
jgi:hypothetical protein